MEYAILILSPLIGFLVTLFVMPLWIKKVKKLGMVWEDMNKPEHPKEVASSGGIIVVMGFMIGIFVYIALKTFLLGTINENIIKTLALVIVVLMFALIGLVDDLLGWKHGGLSKKVRLFLAFIASIPLIALNVGVSSMSFLFFDNLNLGIFYPLILIPLGIAGCATVYNFLAGFNGLEASQGMIILTAISFVAYYTGSEYLALIGVVMVASLGGFFLFNKYPAKVFPGDSMTLVIGAMIASMAILGNFEKIAAFIFIPYILEMVLKTRGKLKKPSFGKPTRGGDLEMPFEKIYGLEHLAIYILKKVKKSGKAYEKEVVYLINGFQIVVILLGFLLFL